MKIFSKANAGIRSSGNPSGEDRNETLEAVIALAKGRNDAVVMVVKDGQPVGKIDMQDLLSALIPYSATQ